MNEQDCDLKCEHADLVALYVCGALPAAASAAVEMHVGSCQVCRQELERSSPNAGILIDQPSCDLQPSDSLCARIARRIGNELGHDILLPTTRTLDEPDWEEVAHGISCKLLATDATHSRVSMLVRLAPGIEYPPHIHGGVEELHLLDGELWIDDRKLRAGDYNRAEPGTTDRRVWSETGCLCVLITSTRDVLL